jgi:hypothetical protein
MFIRSNGDIYAATCMSKTFGNIYAEEVEFPTKPYRCVFAGCFCATDVQIPKRKVST